MRIVGYTPLPPWSNLTVLVYRMPRSASREPLYNSSLNRNLASIGKLLCRWVGPLGRPLLWIARNVRIVGWRRPVGVWMVFPPRLSWTGQIVVQWRVRQYAAGQYRCFLSPYVIDAAHHWQKWNASSFSPSRYFEHRTMTWVSDTRIDVIGEVLVLGISRTRRHSTVRRTGSNELFQA